MTFTIQSTDINATGDAFTFAGAGDGIIVTDGTTVVSEDGSGIVGTLGGHTVDVAGTVISNGTGVDDAAISLDQTEATFVDTIVTVFEGGTVRARNIGVELSDFGTVVNAGLISAGDEGIRLTDTVGGLTNTGLIHGDSSAIELNGLSTIDINNAGTISSLSDGSTTISAADGDVFIHNSGAILSADGFAIDAASLALFNTGHIVGYIFAGSGPVIENTGSIAGGIVFSEGGNFYFGTAGSLSEAILADGGGGNRFLLGQSGERAIGSDAGTDTIVGGAGADEISGRGGDDSIFGGDGDDLLSGDDLSDLLFEIVADPPTEPASGDDFIQAGLGNDTVDGGLGLDTLLGAAGDDSILGDGGDDVVKGGDGDDSLDGGDGADEVRGGHGDDLIEGGDGADLLVGGNGDDNLSGGGAQDTLNGGRGDDTLDGGAMADLLIGGAGADMLSGGLGLDTLRGGDGADSLDGGASFDVLMGGAGRDVLTGGGAADTFVLRRGDGADTITDFGDGADVLDLRDFAFANLAEVIAAGQTAAGGGRTLFDFGDGDSVLVEGLALAELSAGDVLI